MLHHIWWLESLISLEKVQLGALGELQLTVPLRGAGPAACFSFQHSVSSHWTLRETVSSGSYTTCILSSRRHVHISKEIERVWGPAIKKLRTSQAGDYRVTDTVFQTQNRLNQGWEVSTPRMRKTLKLFFKGQNTVRKTFTSTIRRTGQTEWLSLSSALHWDGTESQLRFFKFFSWYFVYF